MDEMENKKRKRTIMSDEQHFLLKKEFLNNIFPSREKREELGKQLGLKPKIIQIWFQNQRQKAKSCEEQFHNYIVNKVREKNTMFFELEILAEIASYEYDKRKNKK